MSLILRKYPKKSQNWQIRGTVAGRHVHRTTHTPNKAIATEIKNKLEKEILDEVRLNRPPPITFTQAVEAYLNKGGEEKYAVKLLDHFQDTLLSNIGQVDLDKAAKLLYPNAKASTINRSLISPFVTILRSAKRTWPGQVDLVLYDRRKEKKPVVKPADDEHIAKLLPHCSEGLAALITLMTYTGLRTGEALRVTKEDCKNGYVTVGTTKNGEPRMVPAPEGWQFPDGGFGLRTTQGVGRALRRASKAAEIEYRDGHELGRHGFAARWLRAGHSIKGLKEAGGWKKLGVVDASYGHMEKSAVHQIMKDLSKKTTGGV